MALTDGSSVADVLAAPAPAPAAGEGRPHRRAVVLLLASAVAGLVLVAGLNFAVNPRAQFEHRIYPPLVLDAPRDKLDLLSEYDGVIDVLVLGSSRAAGIPPPVAPASSFNFALPSGTLRDDAATYAYVVAHHGAPRTVLLGLDSFQFSAQDFGTMAIRSSSAAPRFAGEAGTPVGFLDQVLATLDPAYLQDSLRMLWYAHVAGFPPQDTVWLRDGTQSRPHLDEEIALGRYQLGTAVEKHWQDSVVRRYPNDAVPDPAATAFLLDLVRTMEASGSDVKVFLTPFHPSLMDRLHARSSYVALDEAARQALALACELGVQGYDFTEISSFGGTEQGFYDGYHVTPSNGRQMVSALEAGMGMTCGEDGPGTGA